MMVRTPIQQAPLFDHPVIKLNLFTAMIKARIPCISLSVGSIPVGGRKLRGCSSQTWKEEAEKALCLNMAGTFDAESLVSLFNYSNRTQSSFSEPRAQMESLVSTTFEPNHNHKLIESFEIGAECLIWKVEHSFISE